MSYSEKAVLKDVNDKPIPQYWNSEQNRFEVVTGKNGSLKSIIVDTNGTPINFNNMVSEVVSKLDDLIEVVSD